MATVRVFLLACVALIITVIAATLLLASSAAGLRFMLANIGPVIPGQLTVVGVTGSLYSGAHLERVDYALPDLSITAEAMDLQINWLALAAGEVRFRQLHMQRLAIKRQVAANSAAEGLPNLEVPIGLRLVDGRVGLLEIENGSWREAATDVAVDAALRGSRLRVFNASGQARGVNATLNGRLRFAGEWPLSAAVLWDAPGPQPLQGRGTVTGDLQQLEVKQVIAVPDQITLIATLSDPLEQLRYMANARWDAVSLPVGDRALTLEAGDLALEGDLEAYTARVSMQAVLTDAPVTQLAAVAEGTFDAVTIREIDAQLLGGTVSGSGSFAIESRELSLDLIATALNPESLVPGWLQPVDGRVTLSTANSGVVTAALQLAAGRNSASFAGDVAPAIDGIFTVQADDLAELHGRAAGMLAASGSIAGSLQQPLGEIQLAGSELRWDSVAVRAIDAALSSDAEGILDISLLTEQLGVGGSSAYNVQLEAAGPREQFTYRVRARGAAGAGAVAGRGRWDVAQLELRADAAELLPPVGPAWLLAAPLDLSLSFIEGSTPRASISAHCWAAQPARLCAEPATVSAANLSAEVRLRDLPVAWLIPQDATNLTADGSVAADLLLTGDLAEPAAVLTWMQRDTRLITTDADGKPVGVTFDDVGAELQLQGDVLRLEGSAGAGEQVTLAFSGSVSDVYAAAPPIAISVTAAIADIAVASQLLEPVTGLRDITGRAIAEFDVGGTLIAPTLAGEARLQEASAEWALTGITLSDIRLFARGAGRQRVAIDGSARSGAGDMRLIGDVSWPDDDIAADLKLTGQQFEALRFPGQVIRVSPDLTVVARGSDISIAGALEVPYADITIERLPETAVARSEDVVVVRNSPDDKTASTALRVSTNIDVSLGEDVRLQAFGLDTRLAGAVKLTTSSNAAEPSLEGNLRSVDGSFEAYGREFRIERGVLIFTGIADNPAVNVRAVRELRYDGQDIKIGVQLSGTLEEMQTRLFGEPAMSESDALAYLVLNRPMQRSDNVASEELSGAAVALGLVNMLPAAEQLRDTIGLDEIEFSGMTRESSALTAGKRIGDDFYIRYSYGLFERVGRFVISYNVGRGFSLEAGSGQEQTIDLLYTIDR